MRYPFEQVLPEHELKNESIRVDKFSPTKTSRMAS